MLKTALAALAVAMSVGTAEAATTIGFDPLMTATSVPLTYTEQGYTLQSNNTRTVNGVTFNTTLSIYKVIGAQDTGVPSISFSRSTSFTLTGGTFTFNGLAAFFNTTNSFNVTGYLLGAPLYTKDFATSGGTLQQNSSFRSYDSGTSAIFDQLVFTSSSVAATVLIDDISVAAAVLPTPDPIPVPQPPAVPEPAAWTMMIVGLGLIGGALRRRGSRPALA